VNLAVLAVAQLVAHLVDPAVAIRHAHVYSVSNDNSRFEVSLDTDFIDSDDIQYPTLAIGDRRIATDGVAQDQNGTYVSINADRATAELVAAAFAIPLHERHPLDAGMRYAWRFPTTVAAGAPAIVTLVATNTGPTTVGFLIGGRDRGPRDNRFTFAVSRDGTALPIKDGPDFGGIEYYKALAPGESVAVHADLRAWVTLARPGRYTITATHETQLSKDGQMPSYPDGGADVWDISSAGQGAIVVR
jgi:hypothetical protein